MTLSSINSQTNIHSGPQNVSFKAQIEPACLKLLNAVHGAKITEQKAIPSQFPQNQTFLHKIGKRFFLKRVFVKGDPDLVLMSVYSKDRKAGRIDILVKPQKAEIFFAQDSNSTVYSSIISRSLRSYSTKAGYTASKLIRISNTELSRLIREAKKITDRITQKKTKVKKFKIKPEVAEQ